MAIDELSEYASETKHEKTIRALGLSLAMICYGKEEFVDSLIDKFCKNKDVFARAVEETNRISEKLGVV